MEQPLVVIKCVFFLVIFSARILPLCRCQSTSNSTSSGIYTDVTITVLREIDVMNSTDVNGNPTDSFFSAIWTANNAYAWTDGPSQSATVYIISTEQLASLNATPKVLVPVQPFADPTEFFVLTGNYDAAQGALYFFGYEKLYKLPHLNTSFDLQASQNTFQFPSFVIPRVSYIRGNFIYALQYTSDATTTAILPPKLFGVNTTLYGNNYNPNTTEIYNFTSTQSQTFVIDETRGYIAVGTKLGMLEIRKIDTYDLLSLVYFTNVTSGGDPFDLSHVALDEGRGLLYICGDYDEDIYIVRINVTNSATNLNGMTFLPEEMTDLSTIYAVNLGLTGYVCSGIVIDTYIGVGYLAAADSNDIGYLQKFDIKNMIYLGNFIMPIERQNTEIFSVYIDTSQQMLYTLLGYSIVTYNYPTSCSNDCTSPENGKCVYSTCNCSVLWFSTDCSELACLQGCNEANNGGVCKNGKCYCTSDWTDSTCNQRRCPDDCLGEGVCGYAANNYTCVCNALQTGPNCGTAKYTTCESINVDPNAKSLCLEFGPTCGYCQDDMMCKTGGRLGPEQGSCRLWLYDGDLDVFPTIVAAIIIVSWVAMFIINSISAIYEDWKIAGALETDAEISAKAHNRAWWRDERSAKSWKLWDQIQFLSLYTIVNMAFSTRLMNFSSLFNWTNFCLPFPALTDYSLHPMRDTSNIDQFASNVGVTAEDIFWVCIIWWFITLGVIIVLFVIYYAVGIFVLKKGEKHAEIFIHRLFHLLSRLALAGYLPICCLAGWAIIDPSHRNGYLVIPLIFLIVIGIGLPVLNFLVVKGEKTDFLFYSTRIRYGSLYVQFKQDKAKFAFVVYVRKIVLAIFFGFLIPQNYDDLTDSVNLFYVQIIVPAVFMLIYIGALFVVKPYVDIVHTFLDGFLNFLNILTLGVAILFQSDDSSQRDAGLYAVLIFQITGLISVILAYLYTWMYYAGYSSLAALCGKKEDESDELVPMEKKNTDQSNSEQSEKEKSEKEEKSEKVSEKQEISEDKKEEESEKKPKKGGKGKKSKKKKPDTPKEIDEENLGDLSISDD